MKNIWVKLLLISLFTFLAKPLFAEETLFTVNNIAVDVTASTASLAREKAMTEVRERAIKMVFNRILMPQDIERIPTLSAKDIFEMVREVTILEERTSAVRYIARLTIAFDANSVKKLLSDAFIPFVVETSKPALMLPIYRQANRLPVLWEESNSWLKEWVKNYPQNVVVPLLLPYGELSDISTINANQAEQLNETALRAIASNYKTDIVYIASAVSYEGLEARVEVEITSFNTKTKQVFNFERPIIIFKSPEQNIADILRQGVALTANEIENNWKEEKSVYFSIDSNMILVAKTGSLPELNSITKILENIPLVQKVNVQATTKDKAQFNLSFAGNISNVINNINNKGYDVEFNRGYWILKEQSTD